MMDDATLDQFAATHAAPWTRSKWLDMLSQLTDGESRAYTRCLQDGLRLEQERLPLAFVNARLADCFG